MQKQKKKNQLSTLKKLEKLELLQRIITLGCLLPFLHVTSCLGQAKEVPMVSKIGGIGFLVSSAGLVATKTKEEKIKNKLKKAQEKQLQY